MQGTQEKIQVPGGHSFRVLSWTKRLSEVDCVLSPGKLARIPGEGSHWHFHIEMELTLFSSGEGTRCIGNHIGPFAPGDLVLLGEKLPHYWHTKGNSSGLSVQWHFPESHPFWAFPENLIFADLFKKAGFGLRIAGKTADQISALLRELPNISGPIQLASLMTILARLAEAPPQDCTLLSERSFNLTTEAHCQVAIAKAVRHLIANFRDTVRIEDLLVLTDMSRATFARQFKKHSGRTFSEFLNHLRLQAACRELQENERSVVDIAYASGFTQISFFNRFFRREMKCNPTEFRMKLRKKTPKK